MTTKKVTQTQPTKEVAELQATEVKVLSPVMRKKLKAAISAAMAENPTAFTAALNAVKNADSAKKAAIKAAQNELNAAIMNQVDAATKGDLAAMVELSRQVTELSAKLESAKNATPDQFAAEALEAVVSLSAFSEFLGSTKRARKTDYDRTKVCAVAYNGKVAIVQPDAGDDPQSFTLWELDNGQWVNHGTRKFESSPSATFGKKLSPIFSDDEMAKIQRAGINKSTLAQTPPRPAIDALEAFAETHPNAETIAELEHELKTA